MDSFTAQSNPGNLTAETKPPSSRFRTIFLILLLITLATAGILTYAVVSQQATPPQVTEAVNPFINEPEFANPFAGETSLETQAVNPFAVETNSDNPFAQFETEPAASPNGNQNEYQNPFQ